MELPKLQDLWSEVSDKLGEDVIFLCINHGDSTDVINGYWDKELFMMDYARQQGATVGNAFGVTGYPTNYVIGPDGKIRYSHGAYEPRELLKALLDS